MPRGFFSRLFGAGKMPAAIKSELSGDRVLYETEGIRVTLRRSGRVPGAIVKGGVSAGFGAFAVTDRRVIGSRGKGKWVDVPYDVASSDGPATLTLDGSGLHVVFDLDRVHPSCSGTMRIDYREQLSDAELAPFPHREMSFGVDPQKVVRLFGSLKKLPD